MRKTLTFLFACGCFLISSAQKTTSAITIKFHGKVEDWEKREVLYYTLNNEPFSAKRTVKLDKDMNYQLDLSKTIYKNHKSGELVFSTDSSNKPSTEYACVQRINLEQVYKHAEVSGKKLLDIQSDLPMDFNCSMTTWYGAEGDQEKFTGNYRIQSKDTIYSVKLDKDLYRYTSTFTPSNDDLTNEEWGSWGIENGYLNFHVQYRRNQTLGIMIRAGITRKFKVVSTPGSNSFTLEPVGDYTISKM